MCDDEEDDDYHDECHADGLGELSHLERNSAYFPPFLLHATHVYMPYNQQYHYQIHNPYDTRHHHLFGHFIWCLISTPYLLEYA